jgi:hypothetical protein
VKFDPFAMCRILNDEKVEYVVLGGFAAILRGSSITTRDLVLIPNRDLANLDRLGRALTKMNARIRIDGDSVPTKIDGAFLANMPFMLNLMTDFGEMDITFAPAGNAGDFDGWNEHATFEQVADNLVIRVASLDDIINSKESANRPKDQMALPYLESLRDEIRRRESEL